MFRQLVLRGMMAALAAGFLFTCGISATAYAAGKGHANGPRTTPAPSATAQRASAAQGGSAAHGAASPATPTSQTASGSPASDNSANGNKGHIQIEGAFDCGTTLCGEDNDPHVDGCTFTVELFGYPSGTNSAVVTVSGQEPSGTATVLTDSYTFTGATSPNGSILDTSGTRTYTPTSSQLAPLTPQPNQGYHLRVEVAVNGFHAKTHVIWLDCTPPVSTGSGGLTGSRGLLSPLPDSASAGDTARSVDSPPALDTPLSAVAGARGDTTAPGGLAFTGFDALLAIAAGVTLLLLGLGVVVLSRRAKRVCV